MYWNRPLQIASTILAFATSVNAAEVPVNTLTPAEQAAGWKLLFDGTTVTGLRGLQKPNFLAAGWKVERGALMLPKEVRDSGQSTGGDLMTTEAFGDFDFYFDFRIGVSSDSGILYFTRGSMGGKPTGHQYQIIDDTHHPDGLKGGPIKRTGALYGILPPVAGTSVRVAEKADQELWNQGRILVYGNQVEHWLNNRKVLEYQLGSKEFADAARAGKAPLGFGTKLKSAIVLIDDGEEIEFRNLKIRHLPPPGSAGANGRNPQVVSPATPAPGVRPAVMTPPATTAPVAAPASNDLKRPTAPSLFPAAK